MTEDKPACTCNRAVEDVILAPWPSPNLTPIYRSNAAASKKKLAPSLNPSLAGRRTRQVPQEQMDKNDF